jgi:hypothetical protein
MIGNKKLSTIRQELKTAMKQEGKDPIRWLEDAIARGEANQANTDVLEAIQSVLKAKVRRGRRVKTKR